MKSYKLKDEYGQDQNCFDPICSEFKKSKRCFCSDYSYIQCSMFNSKHTSLISLVESKCIKTSYFSKVDVCGNWSQRYILRLCYIVYTETISNGQQVLSY